MGFAIMKTKLGNVFATLSLIGFLVSASSSVVAEQPIDTPEIRAAARHAVTRGDHESLAKYYENTAAQFQAKLKEQKALLEQYETKSYLYGRQAQDLQSHTSALIHDYEKSVEDSIQTATLHRQMAAKLNQNHAATQQPASATGL